MDSSPTDCAPSRFSPGRQPRTHHQFRQAIDQAARRRRRSVYVSRRDGLSGAARYFGLDRGARGRPSPTRSCRERSMRAANMRSASASAAISAFPAGTTACPCAALRIPPPAKNGGGLAPGAVCTARQRFGRPHRWGRTPRGLECATTLAGAATPWTIADSAPEFGGRLRFETRLPGLKT